mmetsp:Transcript_18112/g.46378  ORF Transcript_18112/g.46378 Transcript_18112/m.46378 type:complete len:302 (-) Transcript_18112:174-1079(-)
MQAGRPLLGRLDPIRYHGALPLDGQLPTACQRHLLARLEHENLGGLFAAVDLVFHRVALHARGSVHGVAKQTVPRVEVPHHAGDHGAGVEPRADLHVAGVRIFLVDEHAVGGAHRVKSEARHARGVVVLRLREPADAHVCVADGLDLEEAVLSGDVVQLLVQPVQHRHHLGRAHGRRYVREANDVAEEDRHRLEVLRLDLPPLAERLSHVRGQHLVQQALALSQRLAQRFDGRLGLYLPHVGRDLSQSRALARVLVPHAISAKGMRTSRVSKAFHINPDLRHLAPLISATLPARRHRHQYS